MARSRHQTNTQQPGAKERVMQAAERLFAQQGFAATSVAHIAQAARANRALLYYYFRDKRALYWAIIERGLREMLDLVAQASQAPGGPWQRLERFVRAYYELLVSRHDVVRMVFREMTGGGEQLGLPVNRYLRESFNRVRGIVEQGVRSGEFCTLDAELTTFSLFGMIHVFFTQRLATGRSLPTEVVVAHTLSLFRHGAQATPRASRCRGQLRKGKDEKQIQVRAHPGNRRRARPHRLGRVASDRG